MVGLLESKRDILKTDNQADMEKQGVVVWQDGKEVDIEKEDEDEEIGFLVTPRDNPAKILYPPISFAKVTPGIYRSGYPNKVSPPVNFH